MQQDFDGKYYGLVYLKLTNA